MHKSTNEQNPLTNASDAATRATSAGTKRYADRSRDRFLPDFYRTCTAGLSTSSIGIGSYLGEANGEDDSAYAAATRHAIASGINLIDTAINYRCQRSERAVGVAIQAAIHDGAAARDELVVCTKGGYIPLDRTPPATRSDYQAFVRKEYLEPQILREDDIVAGGHCLAPRFIRYCLAKSRQNLGLRSIDVYYVHNPEQQLAAVDANELDNRLAAVFAVLEEAADRGEITCYGIATWDGLRTAPDRPGHLSLERVVEAARGAGGAGHRFRAVQLPVNLAMSEAVRAPTQLVHGKLLTTLQAAQELGLAVIGSATLMQARLATGLPSAIREHFPQLATDAQRAIAFARTTDGVCASLVGMKRPSHVDENLGAATV
jgi:aryl-alcohol dehydrogenase-like predicted oxidoreductase